MIKDISALYSTRTSTLNSSLPSYRATHPLSCFWECRTRNCRMDQLRDFADNRLINGCIYCDSIAAVNRYDNCSNRPRQRIMEQLREECFHYLWPTSEIREEGPEDWCSYADSCDWPEFSASICSAHFYSSAGVAGSSSR